jgi:effector-binding domain-containing protein
MLSTPEICRTRLEEAAVIHLTIPRADMRKMFGPAAGELLATLRTQGLEASGALFAHHLSTAADWFDFELGLKVASPVAATGRVQPGQLPAATVARAEYTGPYEGLPSAWVEFNKWIEESGHASAKDLWEVYCVGPQSTDDPASWRTELNRPLAD